MIHIPPSVVIPPELQPCQQLPIPGSNDRRQFISRPSLHIQSPPTTPSKLILQEILILYLKPPQKTIPSPPASHILITLSTLATTIGSFAADWSPTHVFNPRWPPHAKFHNGQTSN